MYLYFFPILAAGLTRFLYDSWWRAGIAGVAAFVVFVGSLGLVSLV